MINIGSGRDEPIHKTKALCPILVPSLKVVGVIGSLAFLAVFGGGCTVLPTLCAQESKLTSALDHTSEARAYQEEALRILAGSNRHSALAVQYVEKAANGPDANVWRDLAEYQLRLASSELTAAGLMVAIAMTHWQLAHGARSSGFTARAP